MSFKNKVVVVTGGSSGIGAAAGTLFAREGAQVVLVARNQDKLARVQQACARHGLSPLLIRADVSDDDDAKRIIDETIAKYKKLDVLVNSAGIVRFRNISDAKLIEVYDEIMKTNVRSVVMLTSLAAPYLIESKGNIVNVSSASEFVVTPQTSAYSMSKAALAQFSRASALELAAQGVRVNCVCPGPVQTDIFHNAGVPLGFDDLGIVTALDNRVSAPEEIADLIAFLASDKAKGITGSNYVCDNGYLLLK